MELPFAAVHQLCTPMLGRLEVLPEPQQTALCVALGLSSGEVPNRFLVALAVLNLLSAVAEERPLLCLLDDAHWLDDASGQVLGFVARRLLAESVATIFAAREPATRWLDGLPKLPLGGLEEQDARALLAWAVQGRLDERIRDRIIAETGGNPLALLELPRGMSAAELAGGFDLPGAGGLPEHMENHYLRRISALPEATQRCCCWPQPSRPGTQRWSGAPPSRRGSDSASSRPRSTRGSPSRLGSRCGFIIRRCARPYTGRRRRRLAKRRIRRWRR